MRERERRKSGKICSESGTAYRKSQFFSDIRMNSIRYIMLVRDLGWLLGMPPKIVVTVVDRAREGEGGIFNNNSC